MILFQVLAVALLIAVIAVDWARTIRRQGRFSGAALRSLIWLAACGFILFPDSLTYLARLLGIGRGADVLLYVLTLTFVAVTFALYARIVQMRRQITQLVRHLALEQAQPPDRFADAKEVR